MLGRVPLFEHAARHRLDPRRPCRLLEGLTVGTAGFYGESAAIRETSCMKRGGEGCCFEVRLERR